MLDASAGLSAAIVAAARQPEATVEADWGNTGTSEDITSYVESITVDRSITTDLPETAQTSVGYSSAELTVDLGGEPADNSKHAAWLWSPYNPDSPLYGKQRVGSKITTDIGMKLPDGTTEKLRRFTGTIRSLSVSAAARSATIDALDGSDRLRASVVLPDMTGTLDPDGTTIHADLNAAWVINYVLKQNGLYTTPPIESSAVLAASMRGSVQPEVGIFDRVVTNSPVFVQGSAGPAIALPVSPTTVAYSFSQSIPWTASSTRIGIEMTMPSEGASIYVTLQGDFEISFGVSAGIPTAQVYANGSWVSLNEAASVPTADWYTILLDIRAISGGIRVVVIKNGISSASKDISISGLSGSISALSLYSTGGDYNSTIESLQVTSVAYGTTPPSHYGYVPDAYLDLAKNNLLAIPYQDQAQDSWQICQDVAAAEMGSIGFDEEGVFRFRNRDSLLQQTTAQKTITSLRPLKDLTIEESIDQVRNHITVGANALSMSAPNTVIWELTDSTKLAAGETRIIQVNFDNPATMVADQFRFPQADGTPYAGWSSYFAARKADGTGGYPTNIIVTIDCGAASAVITVKNPNPFPVWLVVPTDFATGVGVTAGTPWMKLYGTFITPTAEVLQDSLWQPSIDAYGEQSYQLTGNKWIQDTDVAQDLSDDLLAMLYKPRPILTNVDIVGDPTLQLGDRVRLQDTVTKVTLTTRTNLVPNPSFETGVGDWASSSTGGIPDGQISQSTDVSFSGTHSLKAVEQEVISHPNVEIYDAILVTPGQPYAAQAHVMWGDGTPSRLQLVLDYFDVNWNFLAETDGPYTDVPTKTWTKLTAPAVNAPSGSFRMLLFVIREDAAEVGSSFYLDAVQVEPASEVGSYFDGDSLSSAWSGTRGASTSTFSDVRYLTEGTRTNIVLNPHPVGTTAWTNGGSTQLTADADQEAIKVSYYAASSGAFVRANCDTPVVGDTYIGQMAVKWGSGTPPAGKLHLKFQVGGSTGGEYISDAITPSTNAWTVVSTPAGVAPSGTTEIRLFFQIDGSVASGATFYVRRALVEPSATLGAYFDGSFADATWSGTPNNSSSSLMIETAVPGTYVDAEAWIVGNNEQFTPDQGYGQSLQLRSVGAPGDWILGDPDKSVLGSTTRLGGDYA